MNNNEDQQQIEELSALSYEIAISNMFTYATAATTPPAGQELAAMVREFLDTTRNMGLLSQPLITDINSAFHKFSLPALTKLPVFSHQKMDLQSCENQAYWLYGFIYAAAYEKVLRNGRLSNFDSSALLFLQKHGHALPDEVRMRIDIYRGQVTAHYAIDQQKDVRKEILKEFEEARNLLTPISSQIDGWNHELSNWETKFNELKALVVKQHSDLNFVGLSLAFSRLANQKKRELYVQILVAILLVVLLIGAIGYPGYLILTQKLEFTTVLAWATHASPVIAVELLLLYFFRITLRNYYSIKAQLLQLDLRYSLCAFIEGYADFAKRMKNSPEDKTLDRFESIVFSGITADIDNIPGQFDGIDQLATLVKAVRGELK
ncbi:hypothetical protein [Herbaspirillum seropedicae]|uniref:hypothetical protein n=1 Tax=Herbaspirillum seropedicae TaxID=964 RepID=UPI00285C45EA|nr:hypothetical protein [Herbaspirillum seropedicae]MDR6394641.1 preprotein translocase subunit Sss1 [Herbaspirillum seropedicae]